MPIRLEIHAESVSEFDELIARFARSGAVASSAIMPEIAHTPAAQEAAAAAEPAPKGNARSRKSAGAAKDTEAATTGSAGTAATAESATNTGGASESQTTAGSTDAQSNGSAAVDPFAQAETVAATPSATSPADAAAADAGEVTIQQLKDAMADLLKAKSASFAMQTLEAATGCKSLTSGSPNVVEKAKDDPAIMRRTLDALVAAKTAA